MKRNVKQISARVARKRSRLVVCAAVFASAGALTGCASTSDSDADSSGGENSTIGAKCPPAAKQKLTGDSITVGVSSAQSGPYAVVGQGVQPIAVFAKKINADGGLETVDGKKKIKVVSLDDQLDPARALTNVRELVEKDDASAVITAGSANTFATAEYLNRACVPQLFPLGNSEKLLAGDYPFTSLLDSYGLQGRLIGENIVETTPSPTVASLYQSGDFGGDLLAGLKEGLGDVKVVAEQSYQATDATVSNQMTTLIASKADFVTIFATGAICTQALNAIADSTWRPEIWVGTSCTVQDMANARQEGVEGGLRRVAFMKSVDGTDADQVAFRELMDGAKLEPTPGRAQGYISAELSFRAISEAKELSRVGIAEAASKLKGNPPGMLEKGVTLESTPGKSLLDNYATSTWDAGTKTFGDPD